MLQTVTKKEPAWTVPEKISCQNYKDQRGSLQLAFLQLIKNSKSQKNLKSCQLLQNSSIIHVSSSMVTINEALEADEYME